MKKAFIAVYGDSRYDIDATNCVVFAETHGKARALAARELECDFTSIESCRRAPKLDKYAEQGRLTDHDYINEGWSVGCPKCGTQTDEYTARFDKSGKHVVGCEYCSDPQSPDEEDRRSDDPDPQIETPA